MCVIGCSPRCYLRVHKPSFQPLVPVRISVLGAIRCDPLLYLLAVVLFNTSLHWSLCGNHVVFLVCLHPMYLLEGRFFFLNKIQVTDDHFLAISSVSFTFIVHNLYPFFDFLHLLLLLLLLLLSRCGAPISHACLHPCSPHLWIHSLIVSTVCSASCEYYVPMILVSYFTHH